MLKQMKWEEVYDLWQYGGGYHLSKLLSTPIPVESVHVEYEGDGYIYGYDWLRNDEASRRKELIAENPTQFLYFTKPSNKGTIQTAEMLMEAQDEEERAAIWIGATAFELMGSRYTNECYRYAAVLYNAACGFLQQRCGVWHHAMRRLVPEIMIPNAILDSIRYDQPETVMGLIQTNIVMLRGTHTVLLYSSLKDGKRPL